MPGVHVPTTLVLDITRHVVRLLGESRLVPIPGEEPLRRGIDPGAVGGVGEVEVAKEPSPDLVQADLRA